MSMFMMWMLGNTINIFLIFLVFKGFSSALTAILDVNKGTPVSEVVFKDYEGMGVSLTTYKLIYLAINCFLLGLVIYKLLNVGLLPTAPSDWIDLIPLFSVDKSTNLATASSGGRKMTFMEVIDCE